MKEPSFMLVLTGGGQYAYRRVDGVLVILVGVLKKLTLFSRQPYQVWLKRDGMKG